MPLFVLPGKVLEIKLNILHSISWELAHVLKDKHHISTLRNLKLCMCNVHKCKILAVGSCHVEVILCLTDILNSNRKNNNKWPSECTDENIIKPRTGFLLTLSALQIWPTSLRSSHCDSVFPVAYWRTPWYKSQWAWWGDYYSSEGLLFSPSPSNMKGMIRVSLSQWPG